MPITSSGQIALRADIEAEFDQTGTEDISLGTARDDAGLTAGEVAMSDFYGLSDAVAPTVTTSSASSVTASSMTANGNVTSDGGGSITSRGFYFGTSSSYSSNTKYTVSGTTGAFTRSFTGLSGNTTYYMTAFAVNSAGESVGTTVSQLTSFNYTFKNAYVGLNNFNRTSDPARLRKYYQLINNAYTLQRTIKPLNNSTETPHSEYWVLSTSTNRRNQISLDSHQGGVIILGKAANSSFGQPSAVSYSSITYSNANFSAESSNSLQINTGDPSSFTYLAS